jgi:hypothetical protein
LYTKGQRVVVFGRCVDAFRLLPESRRGLWLCSRGCGSSAYQVIIDCLSLWCCWRFLPLFLVRRSIPALELRPWVLCLMARNPAVACKFFCHPAFWTELDSVWLSVFPTAPPPLRAPTSVPAARHRDRAFPTGQTSAPPPAHRSVVAFHHFLFLRFADAHVIGNKQINKS